MKAKRFLAWVLTVCMLLTSIPTMTVIAEDPSSGGTGGTSPVVLTKELVTTPAGQTNIKLEAYVTGEVQLIGGSSAADIVLVLDQSGSMDESVTVNGSSKSKLEVMRDNVEAFAKEIQSFNKNDDDTYRLAIVGFASADSNTEVLTLDPFASYSSLANDKSAYTYTAVNSSSLDRDRIYYISSGNSYTSIEYYDYLFFTDGWYTDDGVLYGGELVNVSATTVYEEIPAPSPKYAGALVDCTAANIGSGGLINRAIAALDGDGATRTELGMEMAQNIFSTQPDGTYTNRKKIIIFLTDGVPTTASAFSSTVANSTVQYAKAMKDEGTHIFSAYFGTPSSDSEDFLQAVSSNYPDATSYTQLGEQAATSYYTATADSASITKLFSDIAYSIAAGMDLDENSVVRDVISEHFRLEVTENNFSPEQVKVYTVDKTATGWSDTEVTLDTAKVSISEDGKTVDVSGFNFAYHCVTEKSKVEGGSDYGRKLVIYIPVVEDETDTSFGGYLPTNKGAGIYKTASDTNAVVTAPNAYKDVEIYYSLLQAEYWKHLDTATEHDFVYVDNISTLFNTMIPESSVPNGENNEGVTMKYSLVDIGENRVWDDSDPVIATLNVGAGEAVDVRDFTNWTADPANTYKRLTIEDGKLSAEAMLVLACELTSTSGVADPSTLLEHSHLSIEVVRHGTHIVGGVIDKGGNLTVDPAGQGTLIDNTYTETVKEGESSATMHFTLKDGYEFSKIIKLTSADSPLDTSEVVFDIENGINEVTFEDDGSFKYHESNVQNGTAVEVYTKLKTFTLTTKSDSGSTIRDGGTYEYSATEKIDVYFEANTGYQITTLTFGETEADAVTYTAAELLAMTPAELEAKGIKLETEIGHDGNPVIVDGEVLVSRTQDNYVAVESDKRSFTLTYKQYIRETQNGAVSGYTPYGTDIVVVLEYGEVLNTHPDTPAVAPGDVEEINGDNYTFSDWYSNHSGLSFSGVVDITTATMPGADLVLHAFWQKNPNHLIAEIQIAKNTVGNFKGDTTFEFGATINETYVGTATVTVSESAPDGTAVMSINITDRQNEMFENGTKIKIFEVIEDNGWLDDTTVYTLEYNAQGNILKKGNDTVTVAEFTNAYNEFTVHYDLNGGKVGTLDTVDSKTVKWESTNLGRYYIPAKDGAEFKGWRYETTDITAGMTYGELAKSYTVREITLVAQYTDNTYTVKYDLAGGSINGSTTYADMTATWNQANLLPATAPEKVGATFIGWKKGATDVTNESTYGQLAGSTGVTQITLVAQYDGINYTVNYDLNGGKVGSHDTISSHVVGWNDASLLPAGHPEKAGSTFIGWKKDAVDVTNTTTYASLAGDESVLEITLVAQYTDNTYTVKYDLAGGSIDGGISDKAVTWNEADLLPATDPVKNGYAFNGWEIRSIKVNNAHKYSELAGSDTVKEITLTAKYTENKYTVIYDLNGGNIDGVTALDNKTVKWNDANLLPVGAPVKEGYTFIDWHEEGNAVKGSDTYGSLAGSYSVESITLIAHFEENPEVTYNDPIETDEIEYNKYIKVDPNGGTWLHGGSVYTKAVELVMTDDRTLDDPTRADYIFTGWTRTAGEGNVVYIYTAQWEKDVIGEPDPDKGDEIPDIYQKKITFEVVNGKWSDGKTENKVYVVTLKTAGNPDANGEADITDKIPTGMTANNGYAQDSGYWRVTPPTTVKGTNAEVYTYIFHKAVDVTYDEYKENDPTPDPKVDEFTVDEKIQVDPNGGIWTYEGVAHTTVQTLTLKDHVDLGTPIRDGYVFMGWKRTDGSGDIVYIYTAQWEKDNIGKPDPDDGDGTADIFQKKITFKIVNGTWDGTSKADKVVVVDLLVHGEYNINGTAVLEAPTTMVADYGYENGAWDVTPPAVVSGKAPVTYTFTYVKKGDTTVEYNDDDPIIDDVEYGKKIKVDPNGGIWAHEGHTHTEPVVLAMEKDRVLHDPTREDYVFVGWARSDGDGDIVYIYTAQWKEDKIGEPDPDEGDEIPDEYQKKIIFTILNGKWSDGTTEDKAVVVTLETAGEPDANGEATLRGKIPTGMTANAGYDTTGNWRVTPPATVRGTETEYYTYIFHKTPDVTYDKYEEDDPTPDPHTDEFNDREMIQVDPNGGEWSYEGRIHTTVQTIVLTDNIDLGTPIREGFTFMGWDKDVGEGDIVYIYTAQWEEDKIGKDDPDDGDDIADKYQKKLVFKVVNGKWSDGTATDIVKVVDLKNELDEYSSSGTADISAIIPVGMNANSGYGNGRWDVTPPTVVSGTDSVTYTYSYTRTGGGVITKYTLTYDTNGGNSISSEKYGEGSTVKLTKVPVKSGYVFEGWYLDKALTNNVTIVNMTRDITVYAAWVKDNGGAGSGYDTPDSLNGDDHFAYIIGYHDGTVRPNSNITRAEATVIFFRLLKPDELRDSNLTTENKFKDVNSGDWFNTAISTMAKLGIVNGRTADTFAPNEYITRAEFAAICARFDSSEFEVIDNFSDVGGHWAADEIHEAAAHGWIRGYEDNTFRPNQFITRAEAITMINRILNRVPEGADDLLDGMIEWPDNSDKSAWYYLAIQEATNSHEFEMKNHIYEKWAILKENPDWAKYEKDDEN